MEAVEMKDLNVGQWGLFDPIYGPEKILGMERYLLGSPRGTGPFLNNGVEVLHLHVTDERGENSAGRFITRSEHEPVISMTFIEQKLSEVSSKI